MGTKKRTRRPTAIEIINGMGFAPCGIGVDEGFDSRGAEASGAAEGMVNLGVRRDRKGGYRERIRPGMW